MSEEANNFIKAQILKQEKEVFATKLLLNVLVYVGITLWLNAIRTTAQIWFVWVLAIIQLILYFSMFIISYQRSKVFSLNRKISIMIFFIFAMLGRVNDWDLLIIPLLIIIMLILSFKSKNLSSKGDALLENIKK